jgi:hypothetical protein
MQLSSTLWACFLLSLLHLSTTDASRNAGLSQAKISMDRRHRAIHSTGGAVVTKKAPVTEGASIPNEIFNLVKSIVGAGVFGLPAGIAAFGNAPSALLPAAALTTFFGILSFYGFSLIGRICSFTGAKNYREAC